MGTTRSRIIAGAVGLLVLALVVYVLVRITGDDSGSEKSPSTSAPESPVASPSASSTAKPHKGSKGSGGTKGSGGSASGGSGSSEKANTQPPKRVRFSQTATVSPALSVDVTKVESVQSKAVTPGETSRPSLRITVRVTNSSTKAANIDSALTNLYYGSDRTPANTSARPGGKSFPARVSAGGTATGVFVFNVPVGRRDKVALEVSVDASLRRVEFAGDCSASAGSC
jgi:hypothetical protein